MSPVLLYTAELFILVLVSLIALHDPSSAKQECAGWCLFAYLYFLATNDTPLQEKPWLWAFRWWTSPKIWPQPMPAHCRSEHYVRFSATCIFSNGRCNTVYQPQSIVRCSGIHCLPVPFSADPANRHQLKQLFGWNLIRSNVQSLVNTKLCLIHICGGTEFFT